MINDELMNSFVAMTNVLKFVQLLLQEYFILLVCNNDHDDCNYYWYFD